jgi:hypothetical protein
VTFSEEKQLEKCHRPSNQECADEIQIGIAKTREENEKKAKFKREL